MEFIITIFNQVLYFPLFNALIYIYNILPIRDLGLAIILLTVLIRLLLYPLSQKAVRSQKALSQLQPKIKELQQKYKNKEEQAKAMMGLYREHRINPASGCLPLLIQLPILIALYRVFFTGLDEAQLGNLYSFVARPESLNFIFLGLIDLSRRSIILALVAGALQFVQSKMMAPVKTKSRKKDSKGGGLDISSLMGRQMVYFMPLFTLFIALSLPAALPLYWIVIILFGIVQQHFTSVQTLSLNQKNGTGKTNQTNS